MASGGGEEEAEILRAIDVLRISEPFAKQPCLEREGESRVQIVGEGTMGKEGWIHPRKG